MCRDGHVCLVRHVTDTLVDALVDQRRLQGCKPEDGACAKETPDDCTSHLCVPLAFGGLEEVHCVLGGMCFVPEVAACYTGGAGRSEGREKVVGAEEEGDDDDQEGRRKQEAARRRIFCTAAADKRGREKRPARRFLAVRPAAKAEGDGRGQRPPAVRPEADGRSGRRWPRPMRAAGLPLGQGCSDTHVEQSRLHERGRTGYVYCWCGLSGVGDQRTGY